MKFHDIPIPSRVVRLTATLDVSSPVHEEIVIIIETRV